MTERKTSAPSARADHRLDEAPAEAAREPGRGRHASHPADVPPLGWKDILWRTMKEFNQDNILAVAAGVTFYTLLAIFPGIAALISLYGLFADAGTVSSHLSLLSGLLPEGAADIIGDQMTRVASEKTSALGFSFFAGLGVALWSASAGAKALFNALNIAYEETEKRSFVRRIGLALVFTLGGILFVILALGAIVVVPIVFDFLGLTSIAGRLMALLRWPLMLVITALILAVLYRYGPSRTKARWRWLSWGSVLAAILWVATSLLFSWYVQNFANYNKTYGSLGAAIGFMTWIWISTTVVLLGAELNAEIEHQTIKDTTTGARKPMGSRGARMADTVGKSSG